MSSFFGNAHPKSNARAHLKQRKKHSGLTLCPGKAIAGFVVMAILANVCDALSLPLSVPVMDSGSNACKEN